jgi:hypothetical protein
VLHNGINSSPVNAAGHDGNVYIGCEEIVVVGETVVVILVDVVVGSCVVVVVVVVGFCVDVDVDTAFEVVVVRSVGGNNTSPVVVASVVVLTVVIPRCNKIKIIHYSTANKKGLITASQVDQYIITTVHS